MSHVPTYSILQEGETFPAGSGDYDDIEDLTKAISVADELLRALPEGQQVTFAVVNEDGYLVAVVTNRRIVGRFTKQQWDSRDNAIEMGEEDFDATDYILLMKPDDVRALEDNRETTDWVGQAHVSWDGPHYVRIEDSICDFFAVPSVKDITDEALANAKSRLNPQPATEQTIILSVKVKIRVAPGVIVSEFVENLDYSVISKTAGITVQGTEIVDSE